MNNKAVHQYLTRYAEAEVALLGDCTSRPMASESFAPSEFGIVIPCYAESPTFLARFFEQFAQLNVTLVLVINQPDIDDNFEPQQAVLQWLMQQAELKAQQQHLLLFGYKQLTIWVVKRYEQAPRIPAKQGVGLARKIGADLLIALVAKGLITCPVLGSSDADAWLPSNYFNALADLALGEQAVAGVFDFKHDLLTNAEQQNDNEILLATQLYEQWLHYYVAGLRYAKSPYSFHTIGSCLAFEYQAYCQVRGFPKRAGGEDFYLLNKLAKLGEVKPLYAQIRLQARVSSRVPFGTGPAVKNLIEQGASEHTFNLYSPHIFEELAQLLAAFDHLWALRTEPQSWFEQLPTVTQQALSELGWQRSIDKILPQCRTKAHLNRQLHGWFDGFRTLRFIHLLERLHFFPVSLHDAKQLAGFCF